MARGRGLLVAFTLTVACSWTREPVPTELIGRWSSDDPRYADRSLEIGAETIAFGGGEGIRTTYRMQGVEREVESGTAQTLYHLYYDASGAPEQELRVRLPVAGKLQIDNHSELWTRASTSSVGS